MDEEEEEVLKVEVEKVALKVVLKEVVNEVVDARVGANKMYNLSTHQCTSVVQMLAFVSQDMEIVEHCHIFLHTVQNTEM